MDTKRKLVFTVKDRCRVCYTCVRECPAKAIRIINGQAEVIPERCIACGNCVNVCSQGAKAFYDATENVRELLMSKQKIAACLAPSFPAEFYDVDDYNTVIGMIRALGFDYVFDVAFGADMVAKKVHDILPQREKAMISSDCPAVVNYVERYHPDLIGNLAPVASPLMAITRVARKKLGEDLPVVFIGPCIAKKDESDEVNESLTFKELRMMFEEEGVSPENTEPASFDQPVGGKGAMFPVTRGMMQTAGKNDDIVEGDILVASGKEDFIEVVIELEKGNLKSNYIELLCCNGCIMGPGMTNQEKRYFKRNNLSRYLKKKFENFNQEEWSENMALFANVNLSQTFTPCDVRIATPDEGKINEVLREMGKVEEKDHLNCGACGYDTCYEHAVAIIEGHAEIEMCLPFTIEKLHNLVVELNLSNQKLADVRQALKHSEKLAGMGQLSAGIAHELNNPLGVITMYANILKEECGNNHPYANDLELIVEQTERCRSIVGGLLNFARKNQLRREETDIVKFLKQAVSSVVIPDNVEINIITDIDDATVTIDREQMMQAITNLEKNAIEAMPGGGKLTIEVKEWKNQYEISIADTGTGIPKENMDKLFTPFFTTKEQGKGTGLGLPLVYGVVKMHRGKIRVESNVDPKRGPLGTRFIISLPRQ